MTERASYPPRVIIAGHCPTSTAASHAIHASVSSSSMTYQTVSPAVCWNPLGIVLTESRFTLVYQTDVRVTTTDAILKRLFHLSVD